MAFRTITLEKFLTHWQVGWDHLDTDIFNDLTFCVAVIRGESVKVSPNDDENENKLRKRV